MSNLTWLLLGAVGASLFWMFFVAFLLDVIAAQRKELDRTLTTVRLYRETRDESDRQVRALLTQNERLAHQLIDQAADSTAAPVVRVPPTWFSAARES
jgi:parvulin-like peptidyl-prolyl isomerase